MQQSPSRHGTNPVRVRSHLAIIIIHYLEALVASRGETNLGGSASHAGK